METWLLANQRDLHTNGPRIVVLSTWFDADGFERGVRINGATLCPRCGLWWPNLEEPDMWDERDGRCVATGWWGSACCELCGVLMIEQPDGQTEVYELKGA